MPEEIIEEGEILDHSTDAPEQTPDATMPCPICGGHWVTSPEDPCTDPVRGNQ